jgi:hypothetical protein
MKTPMSNEKKYIGIAYIQRESSSSKRNIYVDKYQRMHRKVTVTMLQTLEIVDSFAIEGAHSNYATDTRDC